MELTLRAEYWIKFCTKLAKVKCPYNYYNLFYLPSYTEWPTKNRPAVS